MSIIYVYTKNIKLPRITIDYHCQFTKYNNINHITKYLWFLVLIKDLKVIHVYNINNIIALKHQYTKPSKLPYFAFKLHHNVLTIYYAMDCYTKYFRNIVKMISIKYINTPVNHFCSLCYHYDRTNTNILCYYCQKELVIHNCYQYRLILFIIHKLDLVQDVKCYIKKIYFRKQLKYKIDL